MNMIGIGRREAGFNLVELMIAIAIGMFVMAGVITLTVRSIGASADYVESVHLDQGLRAAMQLISRDLRRAGYFANAGQCAALVRTPIVERDAAWTSAWNSFSCNNMDTFATVTFDDIVTPGGNEYRCILFSYDRDSDGDLDTSSPDERYGYRLNGTDIEARQSGGDCAAGGWENLSDEGTVEITDLTGLRFIDNTVSPPLASGAGTIDIREIGIVITGHLSDDDSVSRTLMETVKVRNDRIP